jgi:hypothetical protein
MATSQKKNKPKENTEVKPPEENTEVKPPEENTEVKPPEENTEVKPPEETPEVRYEVAASSLSVGGVVRGLKKGKVLSKKAVRSLKKIKAGEKVSMFDALLNRKTIKEHTPEEPKDTPADPSGR